MTIKYWNLDPMGLVCLQCQLPACIYDNPCLDTSDCLIESAPPPPSLPNTDPRGAKKRYASYQHLIAAEKLINEAGPKTYVDLLQSLGVSRHVLRRWLKKGWLHRRQITSTKKGYPRWLITAIQVPEEIKKAVSLVA